MTENTETPPKPRVDWRTLSEQAGYKVLTFPDGSTISASEIGHVKMFDGSNTGGRRRVGVFGRSIMFSGSHELWTGYDDVDDVFAMATEAHRRASMPNSEPDPVRAAWGPDVTIMRVDGPRAQSLTISNARGEALCRVEGDDLERRAVAGAEFYASTEAR